MISRTQKRCMRRLKRTPPQDNMCHNMSVVNDQNLVHTFDCPKACVLRFVANQFIDSLLNILSFVGVNTCCRLVEQRNGRSLRMARTIEMRCFAPQENAMFL